MKLNVKRDYEERPSLTWISLYVRLGQNEIEKLNQQFHPWNVDIAR